MSHDFYRGTYRYTDYGYMVNQAINEAIRSGAIPLSAGRTFLDAMAGLDPQFDLGGLNPAEVRIRIMESRPEPAQVQGGPGMRPVEEELAVALDFLTPQLGLPLDLFERLSDLLLNPTYVPGEPCKAAAPLLRDLLDMALGMGEGLVDQLFGGVNSTVEDYILPAFGTAQELADAVQAVLDDPITTAFNLILGQRGQIECPVDASLGVGIGVIEEQIRRLKRELAEALP